MLNRPLPAPARDIAMLLARVILGVVLFAHGWQKLMINGISGTYGQFEKLGIPLAIVSASFASFVEFVGGVLIVVGALTTTVVALDLIVMVGAAGFVHVTHGIFAQNGGWELVGVIVAAELALAAFGPGRFSVDHLVTRHREREHAEMERRRRTPVRTPAPVSEAFTPAVEPRAAAPFVAQPAGALDQPTTAIRNAADGPSAGLSTEAFPVPTAGVDLPPRMASAGVRRAMSERAGRPAPPAFGVTVESPLDFTPTKALPVVTPTLETVSTDTITVASSGPGGLPRRVRAVDLPPASAVRPYA